MKIKWRRIRRGPFLVRLTWYVVEVGKTVLQKPQAQMNARSTWNWHWADFGSSSMQYERRLEQQLPSDCFAQAKEGDSVLRSKPAAAGDCGGTACWLEIGGLSLQRPRHSTKICTTRPRSEHGGGRRQTIVLTSSRPVFVHKSPCSRVNDFAQNQTSTILLAWVSVGVLHGIQNSK